MDTREFLQIRRKAEYPSFMNVLKALPAGRFDYRPHEKSPSAAEIVWTLARETQACCDVVDQGLVNWLPEPPPTDPEAIVSAFDKHYAALDHRLQKMDESGWQSKAKILIDGKLYREAPVDDLLWIFFFDAIHTAAS